MEQARESVKSAVNGFHGQLRIALSDGITPSRLPALLARCREEDPEIEIRLFEVSLAQQLKGLHDDLYDAGFSMADEVGDGILVELAWEDELMVAVPARSAWRPTALPDWPTLRAGVRRTDAAQQAARQFHRSSPHPAPGTAAPMR